jgi:ATP-binding cassette subfamily B multidrug efflux pump
MLFGRHFGKYYIKYLIYFLIGIAVLVAVNWYQLEIPMYVGRIIDHLSSQTVDTNFIDQMIINIGIIAIGLTIGRFIWRYTIFGASRSIEFDLRNTMFAQATKLSQSFYSHEKVGGLMAHFINDLEAVRMSFGPGVLMLVDGLVLGGFSIYRMADLDLKLTVYAALPMFILTAALVVIRKKITLKFKERQEAVEKLSDFTQENFSGITVIKAFVRELKEAFLFDKQNMKLYQTNMGFVKFLIAINIAIGFALNIVILLIVVLGSILVINVNQTGFTIGQLTQYLAYFFTLIWPTMALSQFINIQAQAKASAQRIGKFLDTKIEVMDSIDAKEINDLTGSISVKNLTFQYPDGDQPVLKNVSFEIKQGEMVGILGRTGSGKSSLVDLILRIYNLEKNQMYIGGYDIMDLKVESVRNAIAYVPQDNFLFSDTITNNIGFSMDKPDMDQIIDSAKLSDVYDNIMGFQEGFETILGERGVTVSGGQKQRISIARALAKNPEILILDDSVSAVDTKTEEAIIKNLHRIRKGRTTIFIAHRISTVKKMDKIILLHQGEVVAIGSHSELMKTSPMYKDMVRRQQLENLVSGGEAS